jgi:hypothetical protein
VENRAQPALGGASLRVHRGLGHGEARAHQDAGDCEAGADARLLPEADHAPLRIWKPERKTISTSMPVGISMTG